MHNEIIETGKTVEEAIELACAKLGCERENCEWEIIDLPKKGFLGLKNTPAKVRVSMPEPEARPVPKPAVKAAAAPPVRQPQIKEEPKAAEKEPPRVQKPVRQEREKQEAATQPARRESVPVKTETVSEGPPNDEAMAKAGLAKDYLAGILSTMGLSAEISVIWEEGGVYLGISGNSLGAVIGRRGETLDSLQYLCGLVANRADGDYLRITVDCGDYRLKRKETLEALAHKLSEQVLKTNTSKVLEPMNPFERRIIHATVSTIEGVSSTSLGEEPNRRVVITSPTSKSVRRPSSQRGGASSERPGSDRPYRSGDRERHGRDGYDRNKGGRDGRAGGRGGRDHDRQGGRVVVQRQQPSEPPANPPREAEDKPLYGKIEL